MVDSYNVSQTSSTQGLPSLPAPSVRVVTPSRTKLSFCPFPEPEAQTHVGIGVSHANRSIIVTASI